MIFVRIIAICLVVLFARYCFGKFLKTEKGIRIKDWRKGKSEYKTQQDIVCRIIHCDLEDIDVSIRTLNKINTEGVKTFGDLIRKLRKYKEFIKEQMNKYGGGIKEEFKFKNLTYNSIATNGKYKSESNINPFLEIIKQTSNYYRNNGIKEKIYTNFYENIQKNNVNIKDLIGIIIEGGDVGKKFTDVDYKQNFVSKNEYLENLVESLQIKFNYKLSKEYEKLVNSIDRVKIRELSDIYAETSYIVSLLDRYVTNELSLYPHIEKELPDTLDKFRRLELEPKAKKRKEKREVDEDLYYAVYNRNYKEE